jgi:molybdate transport system substrate-binding protein
MRPAACAKVEIVEIPSRASVTPEYGLAAIGNCRPAALAFALFVMSAPGQLLLQQFGFTPVALPQQA